MVGAFAYGDTALVERFVDGDEVAVRVVDAGGGPQACRRSRSCRTAGSTTTRRATPPGPPSSSCPARLDPDAAAAAAALALLAHDVLGLRDLSRTDLVVDERASRGSSRSTSRPA